MNDRIFANTYVGSLWSNEAGLEVYWHPGVKTVNLDGDFLSTELREIADWMDAHQPKEEKQG